MVAADVIAGRAAWSVEAGEAAAWLGSLPAGSVDLVVTSPPYESARLYLEGGVDLGIARNTDAWVAWMTQVCGEMRRVCSGLCVLVVEGSTAGFRYSAAPVLLMADLHRAGFHLRKPPVYHRVGIPGSGGPDWLRNDYEFVVCFAPPGRLRWSDNTAMGHPPKYGPGGAMSHRTKSGRRTISRARPGMHGQTGQAYKSPKLANPGNVIRCKVGGGLLGSPLAHENEAPFPEALPEFFVRSFCPPGGIVCDPFVGSGTTLKVSRRHGRRAIGCDLRPSQVELTRKRMAEVADG